MSWEWENTGHVITDPTGFTIERRLNYGDWELLSYSILPAARSYEDILSEATAALVFGYGYPLSYRVRAYWMG